MKGLRKKKLLLVEWGDACSSARWIDEDDLAKEKLIPVISVGWRMKSKDGVLTLSSMRAENQDCAHIQNIPKSCIISTREVE